MNTSHSLFRPGTVRASLDARNGEFAGRTYSCAEMREMLECAVVSYANRVLQFDLEDGGFQIKEVERLKETVQADE